MARKLKVKAVDPGMHPAEREARDAVHAEVCKIIEGRAARGDPPYSNVERALDALVAVVRDVLAVAHAVGL
jgi:lysozyme family protein